MGHRIFPLLFVHNETFEAKLFATAVVRRSEWYLANTFPCEGHENLQCHDGRNSLNNGIHDEYRHVQREIVCYRCDEMVRKVV